MDRGAITRQIVPEHETDERLRVKPGWERVAGRLGGWYYRRRSAVLQERHPAKAAVLSEKR